MTAHTPKQTYQQQTQPHNTNHTHTKQMRELQAALKQLEAAGALPPTVTGVEGPQQVHVCIDI